MRAGIFGNGDFLSNLLAVAAPFPVLVLIVTLIYYGSPLRIGRNQRDHENDETREL